ncbi:hypothetical protein ACU8KH_05534 [Lachancea thermotolerans]
MNAVDRERSASNSETDEKVNCIKERLESKRKALLNSITEKRKLQKSLQLRKEQGKQVIDAVTELSRLGFSFTQIVAEAGVNSQFLQCVYEKAGRPAPTPSVLTPPNVGKEKEVYEGHDHERSAETKPVPSSQRQLTTRSGLAIDKKGRSMIKRRRTREQPQWLNNLVINLDSSEDEEQDDSTTGQIKSLPAAPLTKISSATKPAGIPININAEVGRITMRLKIEVSRLKQRIKSSQGFSLDKESTKALADKKAIMLKDIEELFEELCPVQAPHPS